MIAGQDSVFWPPTWLLLWQTQLLRPCCGRNSRRSPVGCSARPRQLAGTVSITNEKISATRVVHAAKNHHASADSGGARPNVENGFESRFRCARFLRALLRD